MLPQAESSAAAAPRVVAPGGGRGAERQYRALFERAPLAYLVTDTSGVIQRANRAAAVLLRRPAELLAQQSIEAFVPLDRRRDFRDRLDWLPLVDRAHDWHVTVVPHGAAPVDVAAHVEVTDGDAFGEPVVCWLLRPVS
jgi:PAS domain-containing protein